MNRCVNCGSRNLKITASGEFKKCGDCGCSNIIVGPEHVAAAAKVKRLLSKGWPKSN